MQAKHMGETMNTKHKPATPLPWDTAGIVPQFHIVGGNPQELIADCTVGRDRPKADYANADYLAHAANAYPKLVDALRYFAKNMDPNGEWVAQSADKRAKAFDDARALLRELGEEA